jgi:hypothetical protein
MEYLAFGVGVLNIPQHGQGVIVKVHLVLNVGELSQINLVSNVGGQDGGVGTGESCSRYKV